MGDGCRRKEGTGRGKEIEGVFKPKNRQPHHLDMTSTNVGIEKKSLKRFVYRFHLDIIMLAVVLFATLIRQKQEVAEESSRRSRN